MWKEKVKNTFDQLKCKDPRFKPQKIPIHNEQKQILAELWPITQNYRETAPYLPELLSQWRRENPTISTGTFEITTERTARWLDQLVIGRDDRLLFMIMGLDGTPLGHIGFSNFDFEQQTAEIDSVLRGVKGVFPGLMHWSTLEMMKWGYQTLALKDILLSVFSDNESAVRFYERMGFIKVEVKPLMKVVLENEVKFEIAPKDYTGPIEKYYLKMRYTRKESLLC